MRKCVVRLIPPILWHLRVLACFKSKTFCMSVRSREKTRRRRPRPRVRPSTHAGEEIRGLANPAKRYFSAQAGASERGAGAGVLILGHLLSLLIWLNEADIHHACTKLQTRAAAPPSTAPSLPSKAPFVSGTFACALQGREKRLACLAKQQPGRTGQKFLATTCKPFLSALYICNPLLDSKSGQPKRPPAPARKEGRKGGRKGDEKSLVKKDLVGRLTIFCPRHAGIGKETLGRE